ncbi:MAG: ribonuclease HII [Candidatus Omnitrophica bacterium]|nr:ribonuclease HII [Candidatus Omnitrophota bacterium]MBU1894983.1 ribonuclease HII [Candidatus Omnitrophota bacterium]
MSKRKKPKLPNKEQDTFFYEKKAFSAGYKRVAGIDEAGRGPLAGPVVAGAVRVCDGSFTERIDDSKKLSVRQREKAFVDILKRCDVGIGCVDVEEVDRVNIYNATLLAMRKAIDDLNDEPDYLLIDGKMNIDIHQPRTCLIGGESLSVSIACASIIAKVYRDRLMIELDLEYPQYGFKKHKGYGTREHIEAIRKHGLCSVHRKTFGPFGSRRKIKKPVL